MAGKTRIEGIKIVMELSGFYDPDKETSTDAVTRIVLGAEMAVNKTGEIRAHVRRFIPGKE